MDDQQARVEPVARAGRQYVTVGERLPIPGEVDWSRAPSQFKRYRGLSRLALGYESPGRPTGEGSPSHRLDAEQLGQVLSDAYGLSRQRWTAPDALRWIVGTRGAATIARHTMLVANTLRPVPSGGARFPAELYVVAGPDDCIPAGVHHYDPAHHALETLRTGDVRPALAAGLGYPDGKLPPLTLLVSIYFWKNAFKYGELSYRLCSLDAGVLIGQLLAVAGRYRPRVAVRYQFVDSALDRLLHLDPSRESVYAAITIGDERSGPRPTSASCPECDGVVLNPAGTLNDDTRPPDEAWTIESLSLPARLHRASRLSTADAFTPEARLPAIVPEGIRPRRSVPLPERRRNPLDGLRLRRSSMGYFAPGSVTREQLAELLGAAADGYASDVDGSAATIRHTLVFCAINEVEGVAPGVYYYDSSGNTLQQVREGDIRIELQASLVANLFNLAHVSLCIYPVGDYESGFAVFGDRWYRMQNMEAGITLQRLALAATACGLGSHANLGYHVGRTNRLLGLDDGRLTSLIQVMIGFPRAVGDHYEYACR